MDIGEVINTATVVGTIAGYAGGQALEQMRQHQIAANRQAAVPAHGDAEVYKDRMGMLRRSVASLAVFGAIAGFAFGEAASTSESYHEEPAAVVLAVDHTAKTLDGTAPKINTVADSFLTVNSQNIHETTVVAHNSTSEVISLKKLNQDQSFGQTTYMADAVTRSIEIADSNAPLAGSNVPGSAGERAGAIVILTDGDPIGDVQAEDKDNLPVDIINFDPKSDQIANYVAITKKTGGAYIPPQSKLSTIISKIKSHIMTKPVAEKSTDGQLPWLVAGALAAAATVRETFRRRRQTVRETVR